MTEEFAPPSPSPIDGALLATGKTVERTAGTLHAKDLRAFLCDLLGADVQISAIEDARLDTGQGIRFAAGNDTIASIAVDDSLDAVLAGAGGTTESLGLMSALIASRYGSSVVVGPLSGAANVTVNVRAFSVSADNVLLGCVQVAW